jgi:hypothetical protein
MRYVKLIAIVGLLACLGSLAAPVTAAPAPKSLLKDPLNDANFLNDQGTGDGSNGDVVTPADASSVTDITGLDVHNDAKNLYVSVVTEAAAPGTQGTGYRVRFNPDSAGTYCIVLEVHYPGATDTITTPEAILTNACEGTSTPVEILGNMFVVPRNADKAFAKGATLKAPQVQGFFYEGGPSPAGLAYPVTDTTKPGKDYKLVK